MSKARFLKRNGGSRSRGAATDRAQRAASSLQPAGAAKSMKSLSDSMSKATKRHEKPWNRRFGEVSDVYLPSQPGGGRVVIALLRWPLGGHKGIGFISFVEGSSIHRAIAHGGHEIHGGGRFGLVTWRRLRDLGGHRGAQGARALLGDGLGAERLPRLPHEGARAGGEGCAPQRGGEPWRCRRWRRSWRCTSRPTWGRAPSGTAAARRRRGCAGSEVPRSCSGWTSSEPSSSATTRPRSRMRRTTCRPTAPR